MKKLIIAALLCTTAPALATTCKIVGISDGDTATCLTDSKKQIKIRFDQIDAPEKNQDYGTVSRQTLSNLIFGKTVTLKIKTTDKYGRTVAEVFVGHTNINKEMVKKGMAWAYREYMTDSEYLTLEAQAKAQRIGLWSQPNPIYPSNFRRGSSGQSTQTQVKPQATTVIPKSSGASCGSKTTCGQMNNCAEARHYLNVCGLSRLDRDGDGVPCESLCR